MINLAMLVLAAAALSPSDPDARWLPFEGCWVPQAEGVTEAPDHMVCVRRRGEEAVFATYVQGELDSERLLRADAAHPVEQGGCTGAESSRWSDDGRRVFIRSELRCGDAERTTSTVLAFINGETFVDVQAVQVGQEQVVRSFRYRSVAPSLYPKGFELPADEDLARSTARLHAAAALDPEDVIEATSVVSAGAVNALLASRKAGFDLDGRLLQRLADAGVQSSTLDVMVALSYPEEFEVAERAPSLSEERWQPTPAGNGYGYGDPFFDRWGYSRFYDCMRFGYYYSYGCDYYRYNSWAYNYGYGPGGVWVIPVNPRPGEELEEQRRGTVSANGYQRGTSPSRGTARPRSQPADRPQNSTGASMPRSTSGGSSGRGSQGSVSSGGHSAGAGSQSTGQTAKPRGGGE